MCSVVALKDLGRVRVIRIECHDQALAGPGRTVSHGFSVFIGHLLCVPETER